MEKNELREVLKFYKSIYIGANVNLEDKTLFNSWYEMLKEYSLEQVKDAIIRRSKQSSFPANVPEIISNIESKGYSTEKIGSNTIIIRYEDEQRGNFPFRFNSKEEAMSYSQMFRDCDYDYETVKEIFDMYQRNKNNNPLIVKPMKDKDGNSLVPPVNQSTIQKNKSELRKEMRMLFSH